MNRFDQFRAALALCASLSLTDCRTALPAPTMPLVQTPDAPFRAHAPAPLTPRPIEWPTIERSVLSNGMTVLVIPREHWSATTVRYVCRRCGDDDASVQPGLAALTARWIVDDRFDLRTGVSHDAMSVWATVDPLSTERAIVAIADTIRSPRLGTARFARERAEMVQDRLETDAGLGDELLASSVFGESHPYGRPVGGFARDLQLLTTRVAEAFYRSHYGPEDSALIVAGPVSGDRVRAAAEDGFGSWRRSAEAPPARTTAPEPAHRPVFVDVPRASSTFVALAVQGVGADADDRATARLLEALLGGLFSSRANTSLREERGLAYGAHSEERSWRGAGLLSVSANVARDRTIDATRQLLEECRRLRDEPATAAEIATARESLRARLGASFERPDTASSMVARWFTYEQPMDMREEIRAIERVDAHSVQALAQHLLAPTRLHIVVLGDREELIGPFQRAFGDTQVLYLQY